MCLVTEIKTPFVAEEDMVVYKILCNKNGKICSVIECYFWDIGEIHYAEISFKTPEHLDCTHDDVVYEFYKNYSLEELIQVSKGFHSAESIERLQKSWLWHYVESENNSEHVVQCTIPKGSTYYKDSTGLLVSNQLRVDKIVEEND